MIYLIICLLSLLPYKQPQSVLVGQVDITYNTADGLFYVTARYDERAFHCPCDLILFVGKQEDTFCKNTPHYPEIDTIEGRPRQKF